MKCCDRRNRVVFFFFCLSECFTLTRCYLEIAVEMKHVHDQTTIWAKESNWFRRSSSTEWMEWILVYPISFGADMINGWTRLSNDDSFNDSPSAHRNYELPWEDWYIKVSSACTSHTSHTSHTIIGNAHSPHPKSKNAFNFRIKKQTSVEPFPTMNDWLTDWLTGWLDGRMNDGWHNEPKEWHI